MRKIRQPFYESITSRVIDNKSTKLEMNHTWQRRFVHVLIETPSLTSNALNILPHVLVTLEELIGNGQVTRLPGNINSTVPWKSQILNQNLKPRHEVETGRVMWGRLSCHPFQLNDNTKIEWFGKLPNAQPPPLNSSNIHQNQKAPNIDRVWNIQTK